ncbi:O-antigen ligase domain-containing protein [Ferrimonas lipolytica]|uniref:O-antigen ligase domain-containing protein n=1 Tax=Ferrimonas lipolytica TaxID=2724191 RepID=A0A6H1UEZ0_9GAMM|nr:O-antigen ligase domain-containing protein [Ferrimonas lipolytica]QIZ76362.1 O-antigen ligase domain-containing protein [Ferrimonas lipolytica]
MATPLLNQTTVEEKLIWYGLVLSYPMYVLGALYVWGSVLGWLMLALVILRCWVDGRADYGPVPLIVWLWVTAMALMLVALIVAHIDWQLGLAKTIKSTIGWAKGWALLALFLLLGAVLPFRLALLTRGTCIVAAQSIILALISLVAVALGWSGEIYLSPLKAIGGPGYEFFTVRWFALNLETGLPRWSFFAPWAPAAGLMSCICLVICWQEQNPRWRALGIIGTAVMCLLCQSRAGWVLFAGLIPLLVLFGRAISPSMLLVAAIATVVMMLSSQWLFEHGNDAYQHIKDSRPDSTRVRSALADIALQRWQAEAPIWGHGIVERGPKMVEYMPIGTHHSWYGLLFVKGAVGALALALPLAITVIYLLVDAFRSAVSRTALLLALTLVGYSFFENLEILVYLFWPALLWIGAALNPLKTNALQKVAY